MLKNTPQTNLSQHRHDKNTMPGNDLPGHANQENTTPKSNFASLNSMDTNLIPQTISQSYETKILLDLIEPALIKAGEQAKRLAEATNTPYVGR